VFSDFCLTALYSDICFCVLKRVLFVCQYYNISYNSKSRRVPLEKNLSCNWLKIENMSGHLTFRRKVSVSIEKNKLQDKNTPIVSKCDVFAVKETKLFLFNLIQTHKYKKL